MYRKIAIVIGMPRSGTSWLSQIIDSSPNVRFRLSPIFAYAFKNAVNEQSDRETYDRVFRGAYDLGDEFMEQSNRRRAGEYPVFSDKKKVPEYLVMKMTRFHNLIERMLFLFPEMKMVAIVRNPCGAIHSWLTTPGEFPGSADPLCEWRTGSCRKTAPEEFWGFEDWKNITRLHLQLRERYPNRFYIITYEGLVKDALQQTLQLFDFLGLEFTEQTEKFLKESQSKQVENAYAVFKDPSVKDRWRSQLQPEIRDTIVEEIAGTDLEVFLQ